jgi:hypothetical protein
MNDLDPERPVEGCEYLRYLIKVESGLRGVILHKSIA